MCPTVGSASWGCGYPLLVKPEHFYGEPLRLRVSPPPRPAESAAAPLRAELGHFLTEIPLLGPAVGHHARQHRGKGQRVPPPRPLQTNLSLPPSRPCKGTARQPSRGLRRGLRRSAGMTPRHTLVFPAREYRSGHDRLLWKLRQSLVPPPRGEPGSRSARVTDERSAAGASAARRCCGGRCAPQGSTRLLRRDGSGERPALRTAGTGGPGRW